MTEHITSCFEILLLTISTCFPFLILLMSKIPGPEAFNYGFPQELDDEFLVISDQFPGVPWKYVDTTELIQILCERVDEGFTFPLNPKWILCDAGWKDVYDRLLASRKPNVKDSIDVWYPPEVRDKIACVSSAYPRGFVYRPPAPAPEEKRGDGIDVGVRTDLAILEHRRLLVKESGRRKVNAIFLSMHNLKEVQSSAKDNCFAAAIEMNRLAKAQQDIFQASLNNSRRKSFARMKRQPALRSIREEQREGKDEKRESTAASQRFGAVTEEVNPKKGSSPWLNRSFRGRRLSQPGGKPDKETTDQPSPRKRIFRRASSWSPGLSSLIQTVRKKKPQEEKKEE